MTTTEPNVTTEPTDPVERARLDWAIWKAQGGGAPADGTTDESGHEWAARMQERYGDCPDDLPDRQDGQTEAEYRAAAEAHMERAAAASTDAERPADEQTADPGADSPPESAAAESEVLPETHPTTGDLVEQSTAGGPADDEPETANSREARYRIRLRETEAQLDAANKLLAATRQSIIDDALAREGLDHDQATNFQAMMEQRGHTADTLLRDDGLIATDRLAAAITDTSQHFNSHLPNRPRRPEPNAALGRGDKTLTPSGSEQFTNAFRANRSRQ